MKPNPSFPSTPLRERPNLNSVSALDVAEETVFALALAYTRSQTVAWVRYRRLPMSGSNRIDSALSGYLQLGDEQKTLGVEYRRLDVGQKNTRHRVSPGRRLAKNTGRRVSLARRRAKNLDAGYQRHRRRKIQRSANAPSLDRISRPRCDLLRAVAVDPSAETAAAQAFLTQVRSGFAVAARSVPAMRDEFCGGRRAVAVVDRSERPAARHPQRLPLRRGQRSTQGSTNRRPNRQSKALAARGCGRLAAAGPPRVRMPVKSQFCCLLRQAP